MEIKILGSGCANCDKLEAATREAAANVGADATFEKVSDFAEIMSFGVMTTPALVVDGEVKVAGRVPAVADIEKFLAGGTAKSGGCGCGGCC